MPQPISRHILDPSRQARDKLEKLKMFCSSSGMPPQNRLMQLLREPESSLAADDVAFLEKWLYDSDEKTSILILQVLCRFGNKVSRFVSNFETISSRMSSEIMRIAASQGDADTVLDMVSEDKQNVNNAVILLKKMNKKEYLTTFLFSPNQDLVDLIRKVVE